MQGAAISSGIPFGVGNYTTSPMTTVSQSVQPAGKAIPIDWRIVSPGFFHGMAVPLLRGRDLTDADASLAAPVMTISEAEHVEERRRHCLARNFLGGSAAPVSVRLPPETAAIDANARFCSDQSINVSGETRL